MLNISIEEIIKITEGKIVNGNTDAVVHNISLDTRTLKKDDFFIAIEGENFDGHNFIYEAIKKGAMGCLVDITKLTKLKAELKKKGMSEFPENFIVVKVDNTLRSFGVIAGFYRQRFNIKVIAITGSNGKTTTKELIYALLRTKYKEDEILKTEKNFNNEIGVPLTLLKLNPKIKVLVAELGINHIGEMQRLASMTAPDYAIITNIGDTHLEFLKNDKIVAKAKGEILPYIKDTLILNFDDKYFNYYSNIFDGKIVAYTLNTEVNLENVNHFDEYTFLADNGWDVVYKGVKFHYKLLGEHNLYNLLSALTGASFFTDDIKKFKKVIENFKPIENRGNLIKTKDFSIYFDAYNANPTSVKAMVYFLNLFNIEHKIPVLGDMMELGKKDMKHHTEVINYVTENFEFDKVLTYGNTYKRVYKERMVDKKKIEPFLDMEKLAARMKEYIKEFKGNIIFLIKGSRKMEMEKLLKLLGVKSEK